LRYLVFPALPATKVRKIRKYWTTNENFGKLSWVKRVARHLLLSAFFTQMTQRLRVALLSTRLSYIISFMHGNTQKS